MKFAIFTIFKCTAHSVECIPIVVQPRKTFLKGLFFLEKIWELRNNDNVSLGKCPIQ